MFPGSANLSGFSPAPKLSPAPTLPPNLRSAESAGVLVTLLLNAKKRHKLARSALSSIIALPTDVLIKAIRKGGFEKSVVGCCNSFPPLCIDCGGQHASFDGSCPIRREILSALHPPRDQDIPDAPDVGHPQTTPQGPTVHPTVPATPARHGPHFPPASESTQPETVKLVRSASTQSNLAAPFPRRNLFGAGSTLFRESTGAEWSEPALTDVHMDF